MASKAKEVLLRCATELFAEHGYSGTTIADICKTAEANIAAVNYHFGSKDQIFIESLRHSFQIAEEAYPISGGLPENADPMEKITAFVKALLLRSFDKGPAGNFERILARTVYTPKSPISIIMIEIQQLALDYLDGLLSLILNGEPQSIIEQARANLISLSTVISRDSFLFDEQLITPDAFIERQVNAVITTISSLKS